jgi:hypothetical protein
MRQLIELDSKKRELIRKTYGVTGANISQALKFQRNSRTAIAIRKMAMENGGILYEEKKY